MLKNVIVAQTLSDAGIITALTCVLLEKVMCHLSKQNLIITGKPVMHVQYTMYFFIDIVYPVDLSFLGENTSLEGPQMLPAVFWL